ncbi:uncharacterized protein, partial [Aristolochia californica]|uniref:uncharacterized protein n=1 Tax=Aristolochia californica TaxID=171875 RepID=UPI0035E0F68F
PRDKLGGGPCTYLDGVSKWQWKRMQAKKSKQLLKARLCRECQIYEMRQRAELRAAVSELERPWEVVERAPTLFSIKADEQLKALANRSQFSGGYDLWSERDETQLFHNQDWLPSVRFFPKGVVHNVKPYGIIDSVGCTDYSEMTDSFLNLFPPSSIISTFNLFIAQPHLGIADLGIVNKSHGIYVSHRSSHISFLNNSDMQDYLYLVSILLRFFELNIKYVFYGKF